MSRISASEYYQSFPFFLVGDGKVRIANKAKGGITAVIQSCYLKAKKQRFTHTQTGMLEVCSALVSAWHSFVLWISCSVWFVLLLQDALKDRESNGSLDDNRRSCPYLTVH